jgi:DNA-binding XRE family transcriptional regulator
MKAKTPAELLAGNKPVRLHYKSYKQEIVFNCKLKEIRKELGLSVPQVAKVVGISAQSLTTIELGTNPTLKTVYKLVEFYGKNIQELWQLK